LLRRATRQDRPAEDETETALFRSLPPAGTHRSQHSRPKNTLCNAIGSTIFFGAESIWSRR